MRFLCFFAERASRNKLASATLSNLSKSLARATNSSDTRLRSRLYSVDMVSSHQSGSGSARCTNILKKLSGSRAASRRASSSCASCLTVRRVVSISASAVNSISSFPSPCSLRSALILRTSSSIVLKSDRIKSLLGSETISFLMSSIRPIQLLAPSIASKMRSASGPRPAAFSKVTTMVIARSAVLTFALMRTVYMRTGAHVPGHKMV